MGLSLYNMYLFDSASFLGCPTAALEVVEMVEIFSMSTTSVSVASISSSTAAAAVPVSTTGSWLTGLGATVETKRMKALLGSSYNEILFRPLL